MSNASFVKQFFCLVIVLFTVAQFSYGQNQQAPSPLTKEKYNEAKAVEDEIGFTHAIKVGDHLYVSGTVATGDMPAQIKEIMESIKRTLAKYNTGFKNVIKETVYTTDITEFKKNRAVRNVYYNGDYPVATWVEVKQLYLPQYIVEIEVEAYVGN